MEEGADAEIRWIRSHSFSFISEYFRITEKYGKNSYSFALFIIFNDARRCDCGSIEYVRKNKRSKKTRPWLAV